MIPHNQMSKGDNLNIPAVCSRGVTARSKAFDCDVCQRWTHIKWTSEVSSELYEQMCNQNIVFNFTCSACTIAELPFVNHSDYNSDDHLSTINSLYTADEDHFQCFRNKGLHFIHLNARSLLSKISDIRHIAIKTKAAVISITETWWLDQTVTDAEIHIQKYSVITKDRHRHGGGVCVYIRDGHAFNPKSDLNSDDAEFLFIELLLPRNKPIYIGTIYRPPKLTYFLVFRKLKLF